MPPQQQVPGNRAAPAPRYNNAPPATQPRPYDEDD
jgi:hypothetical protein